MQFYYRNANFYLQAHAHKHTLNLSMYATVNNIVL